MRRELIEHAFSYHSPTEYEINKVETVRKACKRLAYVIDEITDDSSEKTNALRAVQKAMFWSNAAILQYKEPEEPTED